MPAVHRPQWMRCENVLVNGLIHTSWIDHEAGLYQRLVSCIGADMFKWVRFDELHAVTDNVNCFWCLCEDDTWPWSQ